MDTAEKQKHLQQHMPVGEPTKQLSENSEFYLQVVPKSKLDKISQLEKVIFGLFIATFLVLTVATIQVSTKVSRLENQITTVQQKVNQSKTTIRRLEQERSELARQERIRQIAEQKEIEHREENIRKIR